MIHCHAHPMMKKFNLNGSWFSRADFLVEEGSTWIPQVAGWQQTWQVIRIGFLIWALWWIDIDRKVARQGWCIEQWLGHVIGIYFSVDWELAVVSSFSFFFCEWIWQVVVKGMPLQSKTDCAQRQTKLLNFGGGGCEAYGSRFLYQYILLSKSVLKFA